MQNQISKNWQKVKLGDVAYVTKLAGYEFTKFFNSYKQPGEIIVLRGQNLKLGKLDLTDTKTIELNVSRSLPRSQLKTNDLVFSYVGTIGPVALIEKDNRYHLGPNICKISPSNQIDPRFLFQYFLSQQIRNEIDKKISITAQPSLSMEKIRDFELRIPLDITVQQKIVDILLPLDEAIQKTDQIIQETEELKHGLMQQLFTRGIDWKVMLVKEFAQVKGGKRLPKGARFAEEKTRHPYIRVTDFDQGTVGLNNLKYISKDMHEKIKRYIINKEDIFISIAGSIGFVGIIPDELDGANLTENAAKIILNQKNVGQKYLYYFLISPSAQNYFNKVVSKSGQPKLALFKIEALKVPVPRINEQNRIAEILFAVDEKISVNKKIKAKLTLLKKGLMQDIFSQKVEIN